MKTQTKKGILYLGVVFLLSLNSFIYCILIENTVFERDIHEKNLPRLSSQDINIITPENKTYIGGMQGYYPATYGFENETLGSDPIEWLSERSGGTVRIVEEEGSHKNVAKIRDIDNSGYVSFLNRFDSNKVSGTVEFWVSANDTSKAFYMRILASISEKAAVIRIENDYIYCRGSTTWTNVKSISNDKWYHFRIEFDCSTDTYNCWIDGNLEAANYGFMDGDISSVRDLQLYTTGAGADYEVYVDAVGYSWDNNYNIGDNLNEGLLISYKNSTNLDWVGFSLDGQSTQTIYGNTTIPAPNDGVHNIQLFANDSIGTGYQSDRRWFKVEEFTNFYVEDFTTTTYMDDVNTNSSGWGLGEITLPEKNITLSRTEQTGWDLFILGDIAYIGGMQGIYIYDIENRSSPTLLGYDNSATFDCYNIYVVGDYLFGAAGPFGVRVIDVSDPTSISFVTSINDYYVDSYFLLEDDQNAYHIWALPATSSTTYIYIMDTYHGFVSFIFAEPNIIFQTGGYDPVNAGSIFPDRGSLCIEGNIAFCTYGELLMIDISNRVNPVYLNKYTVGEPTDMDVSGNRVYFASETTFGYSYFRILDVSNPLSPVQLYSSPLWNHHVAHIAVTNDIVCIGYSLEISTDLFEGHFDAYDVSNPSTPVLIHSYISPDTRYIPGGIWYGVWEIETSGNYGYMFDTALFIVDLDLIYQYNSPSKVQSSLIYSGSDNVVITHALLTISESVAQDTGISYYISLDNGTHWEEVFTNTIHKFLYIGNKLKWYAYLTTSDSYKTPMLNSLTIAYLPLLNRTTLLSPANLTITDDNTPYFQWVDLPEATEYIVQLDTSTTFNSDDFRYLKISNNYWTASPFLLDNTWYWRVAGIDSKSDVGFFSAYNELSIDVLPGQSSLISPENNKHITTHTPTFTWSDAYDALNYTLQIDSSNTFSSGDLITHSQILILSYSLTSPLTEGVWYWRVQAFDSTGNSGTYSIVNLVTIDSTIPSINQPSDTSYEEGSTGNVIVWNPDDINPYRCEVNRDGTVVTNDFWDGSNITEDIDGLSAGTYIYICTVYDKAGNSISDSVTVTVEEAENIFGSFIGVYIILGVIGGVSLLAVVVIFLVRKRFKRE